jgi:hypothetical protein
VYTKALSQLAHHRLRPREVTPVPPVDQPPQSGVDDRDWVELVAASSVVYGQALAQVSFPVLVLDLPSRRIRAANQAVADIFAVPVPELIGRRNSEVIEFEDEQAMAQAVAALSEGTIDGYRAWRRITARDGVVKEGDLWCRAVDLDGVRYAVYVLALHPVGADPATTPKLPVNPLGPLVVGTADAGWLVERISAEVRELIGVEWRSLIGRSLLSRVHPEDIANVLRAIESDDLNRMVTGRRLRLRHQAGYWVPVRTLVFRFVDGGTSHIAFGLLPRRRRHLATAVRRSCRRPAAAAAQHRRRVACCRRDGRRPAPAQRPGSIPSSTT